MKFVRWICFTAALLAVATAGYASGSYDDVLLVVNDNSPVSSHIAQVYQLSRDDLTHVCHLATSTEETIDASTFIKEIVNPVRAYIVENNLQDVINYVVTTKGVPLRINVSGVITSVDARIALIETEKDSWVLSNGLFSNPYYKAEEPFSVLRFGYRIASRLTGYSQEQVIALINRSQLGRWNGKALLVGQPNYASADPSDPYGAAQGTIVLADKLLRQQEVLAEFVNDGSFAIGRSDVPFYYSWGSNHWSLGYTGQPYSYNWDFAFNPGSIGYTLVSTSGRTFTYDIANYGQSLAADLIASGLCGTLAHVAEPDIVGNPEADLLVKYWIQGSNMGETFMRAAATYKLQNVLVGDPKMVITQTAVSGILQNHAGSFVGGARITFGNNGGTTTSNNYGYYHKAVPHGWSGRVTVSKQGYTFDPLDRSYENLTTDRLDQDYTGHPDCNNNGIEDVIDIANGTSQDENGNGIPDQCDDQCGDAQHPYLVGDFNKDCYVEWMDFAVFGTHWGDIGCQEPGWCAETDLDQNGQVGWGDFAIFAANWFNCTDPDLPCGYNP